MMRHPLRRSFSNALRPQPPPSRIRHFSRHDPLIARRQRGEEYPVQLAIGSPTWPRFN
jgi:hypothetical protein